MVYHGGISWNISISTLFSQTQLHHGTTVGLEFMGDLAATLRQILRKIGLGFSQTMTGWW